MTKFQKEMELAKHKAENNPEEMNQLTPTEISRLLADATECLSTNDFNGALDVYKFLASIGVKEGERELAIAMEQGKILPKDTDGALEYYYSAAQKGDALSAYKYSKMATENKDLCDFWLAIASLLGCKESYPEAFGLYCRKKEREIAAYFCSLMANEGDIDAIIEMARRHLYGDGVEQSEKQAKWYIEKIERAPLHAVKLYRRLQAVEGKSQRPKMPTFVGKDRVVRKLIDGAKKFGYTKILLMLSKMYSESGNKDAGVYLALMHIEGVEFEKNPQLGIAMLENSMLGGSVIAAKQLGDLYARGEHIEPDPRRAIHYYRRAAELGGDGEYEALGDIFHHSQLTAPDYALALSLYEKGAAKGDVGCHRKLNMMYEERERNYIEACKAERTSPETAFILFKRSVDAGYLPAHARIGWYYERGIGTEISRKNAFLHYKAAYEAGDKRAIESLGRCYARGIGVAFDFNKASELLSIAREMGSNSADRELYRIYENKKKHMIRSLYSTAMRLYYNKKYDLAREMLEICMQLGLPDATYSIGCLYEFGITTDPDRKTALRFYKKAYDQGYSDPRQYHKQSMLRISK